MQKESDACIKMVDKIVVIDSNLQMEFVKVFCLA